MLQRRHLHLVLGLAACFSLGSANAAASQLLETVKQNKQLATQLCGQFRKLNASGQNAHDPAAIRSHRCSAGPEPVGCRNSHHLCGGPVLP